MNFVIVTGMSGAGKSKAIEMLEDMGYYCVDNIPPKMLLKFSELKSESPDKDHKMALVIDMRSGDEFVELCPQLDQLEAMDRRYKLLFLDASDSELLKRFKEKRRPHPLLNKGSLTLADAIQEERLKIDHVRERADYLLDTTHMPVRQLQSQIRTIFSQADPEAGAIPVQCMSFGFKHGMPLEADLVFDVRCLPNPFYVEALRERTGLEDDVRDYVFQAEESQVLLAKLFDLVDYLYPLYIREGKHRLVVAMGCTGGKHRSVAFAQALCDYLCGKKVGAVALHRDKDKVNKK